MSKGETTSVYHYDKTAEEYGFDPWKILARRLHVYTGKDATQWGAFGRGWTKRVAALLEEMKTG